MNSTGLIVSRFQKLLLSNFKFNLFHRIIKTFRLLQCDVDEIGAYFRSNQTAWISHKRILSCDSDIQNMMLVYSNSLHGGLLFIIGFINSKRQIFSSPLIVLSSQICDTIRYKTV